MDKVKVKLSNCYGIKKFEHEFDFSNGRNAFLIYASNGTMKTSFANTFDDLMQDPAIDSTDRFFPERVPERSVTINSSNTSINGQHVFVIHSQKFEFDSSQKMSTLLVQQDLKKEYEAAYKAIEDKKDELLKKLALVSGIKKGAEQEILNAFGRHDKDIFSLLESISPQLKDAPDDDLSGIAYEKIFNEKVLTFLDKTDVQKLLSEYITNYNTLIANSPYFRQGGFNHDSADIIGKSLKKGKFFDAKHHINIYDEKTQKVIPIASLDELNRLIAEEKERILSDATLRKSFENINDAITKNAQLQDFRDFLESNHKIIPQLKNLDALKRNLWLTYIASAKSDLASLLSTYQKSKTEINRIIAEAQKQRTDWQIALDRFKERFTVPFEIRIENKEDVMLKNNASPSLVFEYIDGDQKVVVGRDSLLSYLSGGEKRAFYILNIIFEIEARRKQPQKTLLVFDDIADSFDYKNKYAIIEYLKEISEDPKFLSIILTHNFDFFRTVRSRFGNDILRSTNDATSQCLIATKDGAVTVVTPAPYKSPIDKWRTNLASAQPNLIMVIAAIPMARNLVEYAHGNDVDDYKKLTALLHQKIAPHHVTGSITCAELAQLFQRVLSCPALQLPNQTVLSLIIQQADECLTLTGEERLENKVVLSMAIRLIAEQFMIDSINDTTKTGNITEYQTAKLLKIYKQEAPQEFEKIKLLEKVLLIVPEVIHLNAFMYEPLIDLSSQHLREVYQQLKELTAINQPQNLAA